MKLTVLVDNNTIIDRYFQGEPAVAYFIEAEGKKYLFDTGYSDLFLKNAYKMGVNLLELDAVILSHGHNDHTGGLEELVRFYTEAALEGRKFQLPMLIAHPEAFREKRVNELPIGSLLTANQLKNTFSLNLSREPVALSDQLMFLGEIERSNSFEAMEPIGETLKDGLWQDDFVLDDSALVYRSGQGLVIITGCSHAGICNIIEQAKKVWQEERICSIIGGFHLLNPSRSRLEHTCEYFQRQQIGTVYAGHCTDIHSKMRLAQAVEIQEIGVGLVVEFL
ncbi:metallo-beta-lactamase [Lucifera butyrica]|uniref:Metallo-beta-lactamase n=1 Tax=Lucifera butyrica TaxID=1351585 RepID=A0A498REY2_9FIRM|nr:MBL fold metallo-hydrolase [Lucifera butyrica]VBB09370.1 metallo-beta-lactamase [Lucifera butyrica]